MTVIPSINQDIKMLSDSRYKLIKNSESNVTQHNGERITDGLLSPFRYC